MAKFILDKNDCKRFEIDGLIFHVDNHGGITDVFFPMGKVKEVHNRYGLEVTTIDRGFSNDYSEEEYRQAVEEQMEDNHARKD